MGAIHIEREVAYAIGFYMLRKAGLVALTAKQRARLAHKARSLVA